MVNMNRKINKIEYVISILVGIFCLLLLFNKYMMNRL